MNRSEQNFERHAGSSRPGFLHLSAAILVASLAMALGACGGDDDEFVACESDDACGADRLCIDGVCQSVRCRTDEDCGAGSCIDGRCDTGDAGGDDDAAGADATEDGAEADAGADSVEEDGATEEDASEDTVGEDTQDEPVDYGPLEVDWTFPEDGDTRIPLDATIEVHFNQPMNELTFIPSNAQLLDPLGEAVPRMRRYDAASFSLFVEPTEDGASLRPLTPYTFLLSEFIRSAADERLTEGYRIDFSTQNYPNMAFYADLASRYAPVIHQQIEDASLDAFTSIDFDGDLTTSNNLEATAGAHPAFAYYAVTETTTHYFVHYFLYYPGVTAARGPNHEHDFVGIEAIVRKGGEDGFGDLRAYTTFYKQWNAGWLPEASFYAEGDAVSADEGDVPARVPEDLLRDARRPVVFIESGRHFPCLPTEPYPAGLCSPSGGEDPFDEDASGAVFVAGSEPDTFGASDADELQYVLLPFLERVWIYRDRTSGDDAVFEGLAQYRPPAERPGAEQRFPTALATDTPDDSEGTLPFFFQGEPVRNAGAWFVDPAYVADRHFDFPEEFGLEYCFHPLLSIDARGDAEIGCD